MIQSDRIMDEQIENIIDNYYDNLPLIDTDENSEEVYDYED
jgi:hypothetical protein